MENLAPTPHEVEEMNWAAIRADRNRRIEEVDWTQVVDSPLADETKSAFAVYRQKLRDIPQTYEKSVDVVWPTKPTL